MAKFGPGCGLIACLLAQVAMFANLNGDPGTIGHALAGRYYRNLLWRIAPEPRRRPHG